MSRKFARLYSCVFAYICIYRLIIKGINRSRKFVTRTRFERWVGATDFANLTKSLLGSMTNASYCNIRRNIIVIVNKRTKNASRKYFVDIKLFRRESSSLDNDEQSTWRNNYHERDDEIYRLKNRKSTTPNPKSPTEMTTGPFLRSVFAAHTFIVFKSELTWLSVHRWRHVDFEIIIKNT